MISVIDYPIIKIYQPRNLISSNVKKNFEILKNKHKGNYKIKIPTGLYEPYKLKAYDNDITGSRTNIADGATMCDISQGNGDGQRIGSKIFIKTVSLIGYLNTGTSGSSFELNMRLLIYYDKQPTSSTTTAAEFFENTSHPVYSSKKWANRDRFEILYDNVYALSKPRQAATYVSFSLPINKEIIYGSSSGTSMTSGNLIIHIISTSSNSFESGVNILYRVIYLN